MKNANEYVRGNAEERNNAYVYNHVDAMISKVSPGLLFVIDRYLVVCIDF